MKSLLTSAHSGDWHYGLTVENIDRTPDVHKAVMFVIEKAIEAGVDLFTMGGDATENNSPLPDHVALLMQGLNKLEAANIIVAFMKGNHDAISAMGRRWGLTPLEHVGYKNVYFITDPQLLEIKGHSFLFLPHVTKAQALDLGYKTAQECVNGEAERLLAEVKGKVTVVSHYNVAGVKIGTEAMMLRQTDLQLPACVLSSQKVIKIINSHVHTPQENGKLILPGSPLCTDFGDLDSAKGFLLGELKTDGKLTKWDFERVLTPASPMQQVELDFINATPDEIAKTVKQAAKTILKDSIVKIRVLINEENLPLVSFEALAAELGKNARYVKQIDPIITRKRQMRDAKQKVGMSPIDAATHYLTTRNPEGRERKLELARQIIEGSEIKQKDSGKAFLNATAASDELDATLEKLTARPEAKKPAPKTTATAKPAPARKVEMFNPPPITEFDF